MKKIATEDLIQLLGMVGIIGSLIFVGLEMRQSQKIAMAGQQMERTALLMQANSVFTEAGLDWHPIAFLDQTEMADTYPSGISSGRNNYTKLFLTIRMTIFKSLQN